MSAGVFCDFSSAFCSSEKPDLQEIGLDHIFEGVSFFAESCGDGVDTGWAAFIDVDQRPEEGPVQFIEAQCINLLHFKGFFNDVDIKGARALDLGIVADTFQESVCDPRRPARAGCNQFERAIGAMELEKLCGPFQNCRKLLGTIELQVIEHSESTSKRGAEQSGPCGCTD